MSYGGGSSYGGGRGGGYNNNGSSYGGGGGSYGGGRGGGAGGYYQQSSSSSSYYGGAGAGGAAAMGGGDRMSNLGSSLRDVDYQSQQQNGGLPQADFKFYQGNIQGSSTNSIQSSDPAVQQFLHEHQITLIGERIPDPMLEFSSLKAPEGVHRCFQDLGFQKPTSIQSLAWPIILSGRDLVGIAKTGSGKTFGFMVPGVLHILAQPSLRLGDGPIALVLAPTRELAVQIETETKKLCQRLNLRATCLYGGVPKFNQARELRAGVHICIATPGRLIDMIEFQSTNLLRVTYLVLDEADRMLDMGFEPQIRKIVGQIRPDRQTHMFSATWPPEVRGLAASFQKDFIRLHVGSTELAANTDVQQHFSICTSKFEKRDKLVEILRTVGPQRVLIFTGTKRECDDLQYSLIRSQFRATAMHGDKGQAERDRVMAQFRVDPYMILVATDVAARGLDIKDLDVVINYDMPNNIEDYVHRVGRLSLHFTLFS